MSGNGLTAVLVATAAGEIVLITSAVGWLIRQAMHRYDTLADRVGVLLTRAAVIDAELPDRARRLAHVETVQSQIDRRVSIVEDRVARHEHWHEQPAG